MKTSDHMDITSYAVDLYWMFSPTRLADTFKNNVDEIQEGARLVQNGNFKHRTRTLHFFNHNNRFKPKEIKLLGVLPLYTIYPTAEHILRSYIQELREELSEKISKKAYLLIGKILHLVQDMSSPAHVVPIYHSLKRGDSFESKLNSRMSQYLNNFNISQERFNGVCESICSDNCIESIYRNAALQTLERIHKSNSEFRIEINGETRKAGWDLFWRSGEKSGVSFYKSRQINIPGFGSYGPLGRHFGREQVEVRKNRYVVNQNIYDDLCSYFVRKSIEDSLRVLACIENQIEQH